MNLHGFVENDGVNRWDYLGLWKNAKDCGVKQIAALKTAESAAKTAFNNWQTFMDPANLDDHKISAFSHGLIVKTRITEISPYLTKNTEKN